ncbi:hypothetical protein V1283_007405 [Bradyrhizobium sp. AZCC 2262]|uniref:phage exclusion protein Lit family protein n=1 Tax=Bradyrhizobium sp. AZCC 2262 TaxID=3117022 RepID=UPI002FF04423
MTNGAVTPRDTLVALMQGAVPERQAETEALWETDNPEVVLVADAKRITLNADKDRIQFDAKTMDVFWLIGFSGWRAIECYTPVVVWSAKSGQALAELIKLDDGLADVEQAYKERRAAAQALIDAEDPASAPWPPDVPEPNADRYALNDPQHQVAFDLTCLAVAFTIFHEFRHVMLDRDKARSRDPREEELACDVWAREFMTGKLAAYAADNQHEYCDVLRKRSMGLALAALVLHEITPIWDHGGNRFYFSIADRMQAILDNTPLPANDHFWVFAASLLVGIFRQKHIPIDAPAMSAHELVAYLIARL